MKESQIIKCLNKALRKEYIRKKHNFFFTSKKYESIIGVERHTIGRLLSRVNHIEKWRHRKGRCFLWRSCF